jgi:hypothetical protein
MSIFCTKYFCFSGRSTFMKSFLVAVPQFGNLGDMLFLRGPQFGNFSVHFLSFLKLIDYLKFEER